MTRDHVKTAALSMVKKSGLINLSRLALCEKAGIPDGSFPHVMGCTFSEFVEELQEETTCTKQHRVNKSRVNPSLRRDQLLQASVEISRKTGYDKITRDGIAQYADVSVGLVTRYFGTMKQLKRDVMRFAVNNDIVEIVAQGLADGNRHAKKASPELKKQAAIIIANS